MEGDGTTAPIKKLADNARIPLAMYLRSARLQSKSSVRGVVRKLGHNADRLPLISNPKFGPAPFRQVLEKSGGT